MILSCLGFLLLLLFAFVLGAGAVVVGTLLVVLDFAERRG